MDWMVDVVNLMVDSMVDFMVKLMMDLVVDLMMDLMVHLSVHLADSKIFVLLSINHIKFKMTIKIKTWPIHITNTTQKPISTLLISVMF